METKIKNWTNGTGAITIDYDGSGNGTIIITSDANDLFVQRSMQVDVETAQGSPVVTRTVTIVQAGKPAPNFILSSGKYLKLSDGGYFNVSS